MVDMSAVIRRLEAENEDLAPRHPDDPPCTSSVKPEEGIVHEPNTSFLTIRARVGCNLETWKDEAAGRIRIPPGSRSYPLGTLRPETPPALTLG